ncbi:MAG: 7-cyano-7-deazaguanine synthase, partial [Clostridia bacterium]|nr:7-cyano-7-deazaguanine synthase [Clostridia bacterium]
MDSKFLRGATKMSDKKKVLVAMSGGVDSSVAAVLLMDEYDVIGATMRLFTNEDIQLDKHKSCCSLDDVEDARYVGIDRVAEIISNGDAVAGTIYDMLPPEAKKA